MKIGTYIAAAMLVCCANSVSAQEKPSAKIVEATTDEYEFSYGYPAEAAAIPKLKTYFEKQMAKDRAELIKSSKEAKADAVKNDYPFNGYQSGHVWEVAANTGQLLSLTGFHSSYTGGAHGNYGYSSMIWDKKASRFLKSSSDVFSKPAVALASLRSDYCKGLDNERRSKLGADWKADADSIFTGCPSFKELSVVFDGTTPSAINQITIIADPYIAGSYAEGDYQVSLPITAALIAAVKPKYRASFIAK